MKQRYEILYKNNEFLQEYIGRELWLDQINGKNIIDGKILNHSRTYTDIMHRILKEHWKNCDIPVSPHKVLLWSTDKNCKITQISASHMIYDRKKKIIFSDIINQNLGFFFCHSFYFSQNAGFSATNNAGVVKTLNGVAANVCLGGNVTPMNFRVGLGTRTGNLRQVFEIQTPCISLPEINALTPSGDGGFNTTSGLVSQGLSFSSGGAENLTEVATYKTLNDITPTNFQFIWAYDIINFPTAVAQVVNISSSIQL